jgi:WD40 repeat protein
MNYTRLVTAAKDNTIILWDLTTMAPLHVFAEAAIVNDVGINPNDNSIVALLSDGNVKIYNSTTFALTTSYTYPNSGYGNSIQFLFKGTHYVLAGYDGAGNAP